MMNVYGLELFYRYKLRLLVIFLLAGPACEYGELEVDGRLSPVDILVTDFTGNKDNLKITSGNSPSTSNTLRFTNLNDVASISLNGKISLSNTENFEIIRNTCDETLEPLATCEIDIQLIASDNDTYTANLSLDLPNTDDVTLSGTASGFITSLAISDVGGNQFALNIIEDNSTSNTFRVQNNGEIDSQDLTGKFVLSNEANFQIISNDCDKVLKPAESCLLVIQPTASHNSPYSGDLSINSDNTPLIAISGSSVGIRGTVVQVVTGPFGESTCALLSTGKVRCWGSSQRGVLGYGNLNDIGDNELPYTAGDVDVGGDVKQIATGQLHTCTLLTNGKVRCWGFGSAGRLGYGNTDDIGDDETPSSVGDVDVGGDVIQITAGRDHTCALLSTRKVRCWGVGTFGRLGYGNTNNIGDDETPASAGDVNLGEDAVQISAGGSHTCALLATGNVRCWGRNANPHGVLGYGHTNHIGDDETPASAGDSLVGEKVKQISAGLSHTCAVLTNGKVRCWGYAFPGALGYGNTNIIGDDEAPSSAGDVNVGGDVVQISAGASHTCAVLSNGNGRCWGAGSQGGLGYGISGIGFIGDDETPDTVGDIDFGERIVQITAGYLHSCALTSIGNVICWGSNPRGSLGYGNLLTIGDDETPASAGVVQVIQNPDIEANQIIAGDNHTCAVISGKVRCWGDGSSGQLGHANTNSIGDNETPSSAGNIEVGGVAKALATGSNHTCTLLETGKVRCWGDGSSGQLGYANTNSIGDDETPASAGEVNVGDDVKDLVSGSNHTCALLDSGNVRCWGDGSSGQLGYANTNSIGDDETPASAGDVTVGGEVIHLTAGANHTCAILDTGKVRCWGDGSSGQLGYGNTDTIGDDETPASAGDVNVGGDVISISAQGDHTCALLSAGTVRCWGDGTFGQLGYSNTDTVGDDETPASVGNVNVGGDVIDLVAGSRHTCVILSGGTMRCWGDGSSGQLGYSNTNNIGDNETPASVGDVSVGASVKSLTAGSGHTCASLSNGKVRCWGDGSSGQLGYANTNNIGDDEPPSSTGEVSL